MHTEVDLKIVQCAHGVYVCTLQSSSYTLLLVSRVFRAHSGLPQITQCNVVYETISRYSHK